jgi:putative Mg2+ transporter-C (MgtC) family protein
MGRLFVGRGGAFIPVNLHQDKARGVILLLRDVEPGDARLLHALPGILDGRMAKSLDRLGLHVDMDMNNEHSLRAPDLGVRGMPEARATCNLGLSRCLPEGVARVAHRIDAFAAFCLKQRMGSADWFRQRGLEFFHAIRSEPVPPWDGFSAVRRRSIAAFASRHSAVCQRMEIAWELKVGGEVALAMLLGGLIGLEREAAHKPAGFRTHMLVAGAAALLVGLGHALVREFDHHTGLRLQSDPIRIVEAIVTGVSFLGAGTIFRRNRSEQVEGLTTAAALLLCAALGVCVAVERFILALVVTALTLIVLRGLAVVDRRIQRHHAAPPASRE